MRILVSENGDVTVDGPFLSEPIAPKVTMRRPLNPIGDNFLFTSPAECAGDSTYVTPMGGPTQLLVRDQSKVVSLSKRISKFFARFRKPLTDSELTARYSYERDENKKSALRQEILTRALARYSHSDMILSPTRVRFS